MKSGDRSALDEMYNLRAAEWSMQTVSTDTEWGPNPEVLEDAVWYTVLWGGVVYVILAAGQALSGSGAFVVP